MKLSIIGKESLDELQVIASEEFYKIKTLKIKNMNIGPPPYYSGEKLGHLI